MSPTPEALYQEGMRMLPAWNDKSPDRAARRAAAVERITRAAEAGHLEAMRSLAQGLGDDEASRWCLALAQAGDEGPLESALSSHDWPPELGRGVPEAAQAGAPWAMLAVGGVYRLGMVDTLTGEEVATRDGAYGWLPGARDPAAEGLAWITRAAAAGWAPASLSLAHALRLADPAAALSHVRDALREGGVLPPQLRTQATRLLPRLLDEAEVAMEERIRAFEALADAGDDEAAAWLGDRHRLGEGTPQDLAAARLRYEQGAAGGSVSALRELGRLLEDEGPEGAERARTLYEQAAELGNDAFSRDRLAERFGLSGYARGPDER